MTELDGNKVLIVDDEENLCCILMDELSDVGIEAQYALDGEKALELLDNGYNPFLIISDINMPNMNGLELLDELQKRSPKPETVLCTGFSSYEEELVKSKGARKLLKKPFDFDDLIDLVKQIKEEFISR